MKPIQRFPRRAAVCLCLTAASALPAAAADPPSASVSPVEPTVSVPATVQAYWSADLNAKVSGYVGQIKHDIGDVVKKGELLAVIDVPELETDLLQAKAGLAARQQMTKAAEAAVAQAQQAMTVAKSQLEGYRADLQLAEVTLKRQEQLSAGKAATEQQLDDARARAQVTRANVAMGEAKLGSAEADIQAAQANRDVAAAQVDVADAQVQNAQTLLAYTRIIAPFDGVLTRRQVDPGDLVQAAAVGAGMRPLFNVQQVETVRVFCDVPEAEAAGVVAGTPAEVKCYGLAGPVIMGKVTRIANAIDPSTRTMRTEIDLPNPDGTLRAGMYAQVTLKLKAPVRPAAGG